jgi:ribose transport system substrate-binding protein
MKTLKVLFFTIIIFSMLAACTPAAPAEKPAGEEPAAPAAPAEKPVVEAPAAPAAPAAEGKKLTYCYITAGPDTWYKRDVEGFQYGASLDKVEVIVVNSDYDVEKELANIDYCIGQGVDGISVFSFNENGARIAAEKGKAAGIPVVATDSVGSVKAAGQEIVAEIDFDWTKIGEATMTWVAENYPGEDMVVITGNLESIPMKKVNEAMAATAKKLGKNKILDVREGEFNPQKAVEVAQDYLNSGQKFTLMYVSDEDMGAAVMRMLKEKGVLNNPIKVISENGSTSGLALIKTGDLSYSISSSPGWEGYIAYLALHNYVIGAQTDINQQLYLPIIEINSKNIDDPKVVVPWEVIPDVYESLTQSWFPKLLEYRK